MDLEQGQIWWAAHPDSVGRRPVLILTSSEALASLLWVTVAPLTRTIRGLESEVILETGDGVPSRCVVTLDNIATIEQDRLDRYITTLPAERMNEVWEAIHYVFDLPY
jgi:mRNA interferase MazF